MNGIGNDFVVIDAREHDWQFDDEQIRFLADRENKTTKGCDQVLIIRKPKDEKHTCFMEIRNQDGGEAEACGNGTRAIAGFLHNESSGNETDTIIETMRDNLKCITSYVNDSKPRTKLPTPIHLDTPMKVKTFVNNAEFVNNAVPVTLHEHLPPAYIVNVGNPHAVFLIDDDQDLDKIAEKYGPELAEKYNNTEKLRHQLLPEGANFNFIHKPNCKSSSCLFDLVYGEPALRVYERGAGLTKACGTGAWASSAVSSHFIINGKIPGYTTKFINRITLRITQEGGELLTHITFHKNGKPITKEFFGIAQEIHEFTIEGEAIIEFNDEIDILDELKTALDTYDEARTDYLKKQGEPSIGHNMPPPPEVEEAKKRLEAYEQDPDSIDKQWWQNWLEKLEGFFTSIINESKKYPSLKKAIFSIAAIISFIKLLF